MPKDGKNKDTEQGKAGKPPAEMPVEEERQQPPPQPSAQSAPPQRVLFVLRIAGRPPTAPRDSAKDQHE